MNVFQLLVFINKGGFQLTSNLGQRPISFYVGVANDLLKALSRFSLESFYGGRLVRFSNCNSVQCPSRYWRESAHEARGLQLQLHPQGARTHDWPAQPTTKPRAPRAKPPTGTRYTQARWLSEKKGGGGGGVGREGRERREPLNHN